MLGGGNQKMQELLINAEQLTMIVLAVMAIIICWACCRSNASNLTKANINTIITNQDIMFKSINGDFVTIARTLDRIESDVDYLKGKVNKIDEYIDNQSKQ